MILNDHVLSDNRPVYPYMVADAHLGHNDGIGNDTAFPYLHAIKEDRMFTSPHTVPR